MSLVSLGQISLLDLNDVIASPTAPDNPTEGALWWNGTMLMVFSKGQWSPSADYAEYVQSRGENLITNGTGLLGTNYNFSGFEFDGSQAFAGAGSFRTARQEAIIENDEFIPVDPSKRYRASYFAKSKLGTGVNYGVLATYDIDKQLIESGSRVASDYPIIELAKDLKLGDTVIHLKSLDGLVDDEGDNSHYHSLMFWGYKNSFGYEYPAGTYSRFSFSQAWKNGAIDRTAKTITLSRPFDTRNPHSADGSFKAGHKLSGTHFDSVYLFTLASYEQYPKDEWKKYEGTISGLGNDSSPNSKFPHGTAFLRMGWMVNNDYEDTGTEDEIWISGISLTDISETSNLEEIVTEISVTLGNMANDDMLDFSERKHIKDALVEIFGDAWAVMDETEYLPAVSSLDYIGRGSFYHVRNNARVAGIKTDNPLYIDVATQYENLATYLEEMTPIKPWDLWYEYKDVVIEVNKNVFRTNWINYYDAVRELATETSRVLKENADNIIIGGTNLIPNSSGDIGLEGWSLYRNSTNLEIYNGRVTGNSVKFTVTEKGQGVSTPKTFTGALIEGQEYTISYWIMPSQYIMTTHLLRFFDAQGVELSPITYSDIHLDTNIWEHVTQTFVSPPSAVTMCISPVAVGTGLPALPNPIDLWVDEAKIEKGNRASQWSPAPQDIDSSIGIIEERVTDVEWRVTEEGILSSVSETFNSMLESKANAEDLSDFATLSELEILGDEVNLLGQNLNSIDLSPYVTKSEMSQTAQDITANFSRGGGVNLLRNSVAFADLDYWTTSSGSNIGRIEGEDLRQLGFGSGFYIPTASNTRTMEQEVSVEVGTPYTLSWYLNKANSGTTETHSFIVQILENGTVKYATPSNSNINTGGFKKYYATYVPTSGRITVKFIANSAVNAMLSGIMLNKGSFPLEWTMARGEIYNTNVRLDINGIQVVQYENGNPSSQTMMTPQKFGGYYDVNGDGVIDTSNNSIDEVFRMDRDEFVMKKAKAKDEISMGDIRIVKITSSERNGWAIV